MESQKTVLDLELFEESQKDFKYGNKIVINVIMTFLLKDCTDISDQFLDTKIDHEDLFELLVIIPRIEKYYPLIQKIIQRLFNSRGFQNTTLINFLKNFADSPQIVEFYVDLERKRIARVNYGASA